MRYRLLFVFTVLPFVTFSQISFSAQEGLFDNFFSGVPMGVADMNGDGLDDIIHLDNTQLLYISYQQPDTSIFVRKFIGDLGEPKWSLCVGDLDGNGFNDVFTGGRYDGFHIARATDDGTSFSISVINDPLIFLQGSNFADINNDGALDVFACHDDGLSVPLRNDGNGNLAADYTLLNPVSSIPSDNSGNYGSVWTDYDNDGDLDLYISKCRAGVDNPFDGRRLNLLFRNDGNNNYTDVALGANLQIGAQSWAADFADIDNDGDLDCFVINHDTNNNLLRNNGNGTFTDITLASGIPSLFSSIGSGLQLKFADFDNDGFVDLLFTTLNQKHALLRNNGNNTFSKVNNAFQINNQRIHSAVVGDLNEDGFLDVYAGFGFGINQVSNEHDKLFLNDGNENHFIKARLQGRRSNINGIGARVEIYGSWGKQIREIRSGESYGIMNSFTAHFGLGAAEKADSLIVRWPSGEIDLLANLSIDTTYFIPEGEYCLAQAAFRAETLPGLAIQFEGQGDAGTESWKWNFGDGRSDTSQSVTHIYEAPGSYQVCLATSGHCGLAQSCKTIEIQCLSPVADFSYSADGLDLEFEDQALGGANRWVWEIGDGTVYNTQNPSHGFNNPGTYFVCLTAYNNCGNSTFCDFIQVSCDTVRTRFEHQIDSLTVRFDDQSSSGTTSWQWDFGDGATSTEADPSHTYSRPGSYEVCLQIDNVCGPGPQLCRTLEVNCSPPQAAFSFLSDELRVSFQDTSGLSPERRFWDFGDNNTDTIPDPSHTFAAPGEYEVCLTIEDACGESQVCDTVSVSCAAPQAAFAYTTSELSLGLTDTSANGPTEWLWVIEGTDTLMGQNAQYTFDSSGVYEVCLTAGSICGQSQACKTITISCAPPQAGFSLQQEQLTVSLTDTSSANVVAYEWDFGDGNASSLPNPSHTYAQLGTYEICLTVVNACGESSQACRQLVLDCLPPQPAFTFESNRLSLFLDDNSANSPTQWQWDLGDGNSSSEQNPQHIYGNAGEYEVCLTVENECGSAQSCQAITITCPEPQASFTTQRNGLTVDFADASTNQPGQWLWSFGDGNSAEGPNPQHTYNAPGTYVVCLLASSVCGSSQNCRQVNISCMPPQAGFSFQSDELALSFIDESSNNPSEWLWSFGDGNSSLERNPQHTYDAPGNYQVCLTASSLCGSTQQCLTVAVQCAAPQPAFSVESEELAFAFTDNSTQDPQQWFWTFGDGNTSNLPNPRHTYAAPGNYEVCLQVASVCGSNATCQNVQAGCSPPDAGFTLSTDGLTLIVQDTSSQQTSSRSWSFGDGATAAAAQATHEYAQPGTYEVCLELSTICGSNRSCQVISLSCTAPEADFSVEKNQRQIAFFDQSTNGPTEWQWDFGDGSQSEEANPVHTYELPGTYEICLTAGSVCGSSQACRSITVNCNAPQANFATEANELAFSFSDLSMNGPTSWLWSFGDGDTSILQNPVHIYDAPGSYLACLQVSSPCGNTRRCELIQASCTPPQAGFSFTTDGLAYSFQDTSTADAAAWFWDFGDGITSTLPAPQHTYAQPGEYEVCLTVSNICGSTSSCTTLTASCPAPAAGFSFTLEGSTAFFENNSSNTPTLLLWSFGDGDTSTLANPQHSYELPGAYETCLVAANICGADTSCQTIEIMAPSSTEQAAAEKPALKLFPNPASAFSLLEMKAAEDKPFRWELFNSLGQQIRRGKGMVNTTERIEMDGLESGLYWLRVWLEEHMLVERLLKQ